MNENAHLFARPRRSGADDGHRDVCDSKVVGYSPLLAKSNSRQNVIQL